MVTAIPTTAYYAVLTACWKDDPALLARYHAQAPCTLEQAVEHSVATLTGGQLAADFTFYALHYHGEVVGFFGVEPAGNCLVTFGLAAAHRSIGMKAMLWYWIRRFTDPGRPLLCALYEHNTRAHRWLRSLGGYITHRVTHQGRQGVVFTL